MTMIIVEDEYHEYDVVLSSDVQTILCNLKKKFKKLLPKITGRLPVATKICLNLNVNRIRIGFLLFHFNKFVVYFQYKQLQSKINSFPFLWYRDNAVNINRRWFSTFGQSHWSNELSLIWLEEEEEKVILKLGAKKPHRSGNIKAHTHTRRMNKKS